MRCAEKKGVNGEIRFAGRKLKNRLTASSGPLTETDRRVRRCYEAGFGCVILKTAAEYQRTGEGYGRKVVFLGEDYFADASFEREILTMEEGLRLFESASFYRDEMLVIPSVSAQTMEAEDWLRVCRGFEALGAEVIQLDFFYHGTVGSTKNEAFYRRLKELLSELKRELRCALMPKLNFNFEPQQVCEAVAESGVGQVSLLDSVRFPLPVRFGLHAATTSYFGRKQLPLTLSYLQCAVQYGLEVCAGGGVGGAEDVDLLLENGACLVQTASYVLRNGFSRAMVLLHREPVHVEEGQKTWCDADGYGKAGCEKCGFCLAGEP